MSVFSSVYGRYLAAIALLAILSMVLLHMHTSTMRQAHIHPFHAAAAGGSSSSSVGEDKTAAATDGALDKIMRLNEKRDSNREYPKSITEQKSIPTAPANTNNNMNYNPKAIIDTKLVSNLQQNMHMLLHDDGGIDKKPFPARIFLDFHYTSNQFTFVNYKALESIISLYYNKDDVDKTFKTLEVLLLAPHSANYYKVGTFISKHYFEKYLKYGFQVKVVVIYESDVFFRWGEDSLKNEVVAMRNARKRGGGGGGGGGEGGRSNEANIKYDRAVPMSTQIGLGLAFFEREMLLCCSLKIIEQLKDVRFHPIYLLTYARLMNLYLYGGIYFDFTWMQQTRLDEYPSFMTIREAAAVVSYCTDKSMVGYFDDSIVIDRGSKRDVFNRYCHSSSVLVFRQPLSPVLLCVLELYEDESSSLQTCIKSTRSDYNDNVVIGNACIMSVFDKCFKQEKVINEFDAFSFDPATSSQHSCFEFTKEGDRAYLHSQMTNSSRFKSNAPSGLASQYLVESIDNEFSINYYCSYPLSVVPWLSSFTNIGNSVNAITGSSKYINRGGGANGGDFIYDVDPGILSLFNNLKIEVDDYWGTLKPATSSLSTTVAVAAIEETIATKTIGSISTASATATVTGTNASIQNTISRWLGPLALSDSWALPSQTSQLHNKIEENNEIVRQGRAWQHKCNHYYNPFSSRQAIASCSPYFVIPGFMKAGSTFLYDLILTNANNRNELTRDTIDRGEIRALHNLRGGSFKETGCYDLPSSFLLNDGYNNQTNSNSNINPSYALSKTDYIKSGPLNFFQRRMNCFPFVEDGEPFIFGDATVYNINRPGSHQFIALDSIRNEGEVVDGMQADDPKVFVPVVISVRHPVRRFLSHYKFTSNNVDLGINGLVREHLYDRNGGLWTLHYIAKHALYLLGLMNDHGKYIKTNSSTSLSSSSSSSSSSSIGSLEAGSTRILTLGTELHGDNDYDYDLIADSYAKTIRLLSATFLMNGELSIEQERKFYVIRSSASSSGNSSSGNSSSGNSSSGSGSSGGAVDDGDKKLRYLYHHLVDRMPGQVGKINYDKDKLSRYAFVLLSGSMYLPPILHFSTVLDFYGNKRKSYNKLNENIYIVCVEKLNFKSKDSGVSVNSVLGELNSLFSFMKIAFNTEVRPVSFFETYLKTKLNLTLEDFTSTNLNELYDPFNKLLDVYMGDDRKCSY